MNCNPTAQGVAYHTGQCRQKSVVGNGRAPDPSTIAILPICLHENARRGCGSPDDVCNKLKKFFAGKPFNL